MSFDDPFTDNRIYGTALLVLIAAITAIGIKTIAKVSFVFFIAVLAALLAALLGLLSSNRAGLIEYIVGFPGNFSSNFGPGYTLPDLNGAVDAVTFFNLFGIFFPSVTGFFLKALL